MASRKLTKNEMLRQVKMMNDEDYVTFLEHSLDFDRPPTSLNALKNHFCDKIKKGNISVLKVKQERRRKKEELASSTSVGKGYLPPSVLDIGLFNKPACKIPLIFRGDLIPNDGQVYIDVEKINVNVGTKEQPKHEQVAATIALVDNRRNVLLWAIIKPRHEVCQYFTPITGLDEQKMSMGMDLDIVKGLMKNCLLNNQLIGCDVDQDLKSLGNYQHDDVYDIQSFQYDDKGQKHSLLSFATHFFGKKDFQCAAHAAISDARMTQKVYKKMYDYSKFRSSYHKKIERVEKPPIDWTQLGRCTCGVTVKKNRHKMPKRHERNYQFPRFVHDKAQSSSLTLDEEWE